MDSSNAELLARVASLYYEEGLKQREIAELIGVSRSKVSRLLEQAHKKGVVDIRIKHYIERASEAEKALETGFKLQKAIVAEVGSSPYENVLASLGELAARFIERTLRDDLILGISWGTAVHATVRALRVPRPMRVHVIQMIGGMTSDATGTDGVGLAWELARRVGGKCDYLHAPLMVESASLRQSLVQEAEIARVLELARRADLALVGIGSVVAEVSSLLRTGYIGRRELEAMSARGAVGDVCSRHFDIHGMECDLALNSRVVGISLSNLKKISCVVGVAGGPKKAKAILGALRGELIGVLVTDRPTAEAVLRMESGRGL